MLTRELLRVAGRLPGLTQLTLPAEWGIGWGEEYGGANNRMACGTPLGSILHLGDPEGALQVRVEVPAMRDPGTAFALHERLLLIATGHQSGSNARTEYLPAGPGLARRVEWDVCERDGSEWAGWPSKTAVGEKRRLKQEKQEKQEKRQRQQR